MRLAGFEPATFRSGGIPASLLPFTPSLSFHSITSLRGFCFRSQSIPFPVYFLDFWNTFGTPATDTDRAELKAHDRQGPIPCVARFCVAIHRYHEAHSETPGGYLARS